VNHFKCNSCNKYYCGDHIHETHEIFTGSQNGLGVLTMCGNGLNNGTFAGTWKNGKEHGCGIFTWPSGFKTLRQYQEGKLVSEVIFDKQESQLPQ